MRTRMSVLLALLILIATAMMSMQAASGQDAGRSSPAVDQPTLKIMQVQNAEETEQGAAETEQEAAERRIWNSFVENFDYQWEILNSTAQGNGSNESIRDAMVATTALLVLNSQGLAEAESITPSEEFRDFHNYTVTSMKYFNIYLYNMAKLFETRKARYSNTGREALNYSVQYYNLGKAEAEFLF